MADCSTWALVLSYSCFFAVSVEQQQQEEEEEEEERGARVGLISLTALSHLTSTTLTRVYYKESVCDKRGLPLTEP